MEEKNDTAAEEGTPQWRASTSPPYIAIADSVHDVYTGRDEWRGPWDVSGGVI